MKLGITLATLRPSMWTQVARLADGLGFESVWIPEHLVLPVQASGSPHAGSHHPPIPSTTPVFDAFVVLAAIAAQTSRLRLGTNVYNVGLRHPFSTARAVATLDVLSGGRVELGVGASWLAEEWDAVGLDFRTRGARVDEALTVCRRLWTEPEVAFCGEHFRFDAVAFEPKPVQAHVPVVVGGDGPRAWRRVAEHGDGWIPMNTRPEDLPAARAEVARLREQCGRDPRFEITAMFPASSPEDVERYARLGVDRLVLSPWRRSAEAPEALQSFAALHRLPAAPAPG